MDKKEKRAAALVAKLAAQKEKKNVFDILSELDEKSMNAETKAFFKALQDKFNAASEFTVNTKDFEEVLALVGELEEEVMQAQENVSDKVEEILDAAGIKEFKKNFMAEVNEKLLHMRSVAEKGMGKGEAKVKDVREYILEKAAELKSMKGQQNGAVTIEIPMMKKDAPNFIGGYNINHEGTIGILNMQIQPGVVAIVHPTAKVLNYVQTQPISSPTLVVTNEVVGPDGGDFEWTEEGALKPYVDFDFKVEMVSAAKIAAFSKASREALTDVSFMQSETERIINGKYERKLSSEVLNGEGNSDESINGIAKYATPYIQTCLNGEIQTPGLSEVLFAAATQIRNLGFEGTLTAFVNPCDWAIEKMRKNTVGELLEMNKLLEGINVVDTTEIAQGAFLIGDLSVYTLYVYENYGISYGYENDDFRRNLVSLVAESRCFGFVPENHYGALVIDEIDNVATLIEKEV